MPRPTLEVAVVFRAHGQRWRDIHVGHISLAQLKVISAVEHCRSELLGGLVLHCPACDHVQIVYNSCRNRHCLKCQASTAKRLLAARQTELLPVDYYHVVFILPQPISELAYYNKSVTVTLTKADFLNYLTTRLSMAVLFPWLNLTLGAEFPFANLSVEPFPFRKYKSGVCA